MADFPGEELFDPINEGLKTFREIKRKKAEEARSDTELRLKQAKDAREQQETVAKQEYADYLLKEAPSSSIRDRGIAAREVLQGRAPTAGLKSQYNPDSNFFPKFKVKLVTDYGNTLEEMADPNADQGAVSKKLEGLERTMTLVGMKTATTDGMKAKVQQAEKDLGKLNKAYPTVMKQEARNIFENTTVPLLKPLLKSSGMSEDQIDQVLAQQAEKDWQSIFVDIPTTGDAVSSYLGVLKKEPNKYDQFLDQRNLQTKVFGIGSSKQLAKFFKEQGHDMDVNDQFEMIQAISMREMADVIERITGKPYGNIYGDVGMLKKELSEAVAAGDEERVRGIAKKIKVQPITSVLRKSLENKAPKKAKE